MIKWFCTWILSQKLSDEYLRGVKDGVNQQRYDPKSAEWMWEEE